MPDSITDTELATIRQVLKPHLGKPLGTYRLIDAEEELSAALGLPVSMIPPNGWYGGLVVRVHDGHAVRRYAPFVDRAEEEKRLREKEEKANTQSLLRRFLD